MLPSLYLKTVPEQTVYPETSSSYLISSPVPLPSWLTWVINFKISLSSKDKSCSNKNSTNLVLALIAPSPPPPACLEIP